MQLTNGRLNIIQTELSGVCVCASVLADEFTFSPYVKVFFTNLLSHMFSFVFSKYHAALTVCF